MRHFIVNHTEPNSTVAEWKEAIKTSFGITYYNDMLVEILQQYATFYWVYELQEQYMYGSSRLGSVQRHLPLVQQVLNSDSLIYYSYLNDSIRYMERGQKRFELSNHLGNVLAVVTDRKLVHCSGEELMWFEAQIVSVTDYYPFGMEIKERTYVAVSASGGSVSSYRYGFNGMERDDELKGSGNSYDFGARIYDSRLGRWLSLDPLMKKYPSLSAYNFVANNPIFWIDGDGRKIINPYDKDDPEQKENYIKVQRAINIVKVVMKELYDELHNNDDVEIKITIGNLDSEYSEENFTTTGNASSFKNFETKTVHNLGKTLLKPLLGPESSGITVVPNEDGIGYKIVKREWDDVKDEMVENDIAMKDVKGISFNNEITIILEDGLESLHMLGKILSHEMSHSKDAISNMLKVYFDGIAKEKGIIDADDTDDEKQAEKTDQEFTKKFYKLSWKIKKQAETIGDESE